SLKPYNSSRRSSRNWSPGDGRSMNAAPNADRVAIAVKRRGPNRIVAVTVHSRYLTAKQQRRKSIEELIELAAHHGRRRPLPLPHLAPSGFLTGPRSRGLWATAGNANHERRHNLPHSRRAHHHGILGWPRQQPLRQVREAGRGLSHRDVRRVLRRILVGVDREEGTSLARHGCRGPGPDRRPALPGALAPPEPWIPA